MKAVRIDNALVQSHSDWNKYHSTLQQVAEKDYPRMDYFANAIQVDCLDVDAIEIGRGAGYLDCTTDASIGISAIEDENNSRQLMLIELRMGYESIGQVHFNDWKKKVEHSSQLLGGQIQIRSHYVFVFAPKLKGAIYNSWFRAKITDRELEKYEVVAPNDLAEACKSEDQWPVKLAFDENQLITDLTNKIVAGNVDDLITFADYWLKEAGKYQQSYKLEEVKTIRKIFVETFSKVSTSMYDSDLIELIVNDFR